MEPTRFRIGTFIATVVLVLLNITWADSVPVAHNNERIQKRQVAAFTFAKHFQSHMVLQKEPARANVYGFSEHVGQTVTAHLITPAKTYTYTTKVLPGANSTNPGQWSVLLDAQNADTQATLSVTVQGTTVNLTDVIFGDVWICSGQSNMGFSVNQMRDAAAEKADFNYTKIRLFTVADKESPTPLDDLLTVSRAWSQPDSNTVGAFSAVCWVYGKNIHKALGYSIGLVHSSWGGTPAESWSSNSALVKCGNAKPTAPKSPDHVIGDDSKGSEVSARNQNDNSVLWNAMIHPFLKMTIKGAIWYQGEADTGGIKRDHYNCTFPTMIQDWRNNFHQASNNQTRLDFPFGFVQLAPNGNNPTQAVGFPDVRWHQTADKGFVPNPAMPNTFMAVAMDLPDFNSTYGTVHPRDKKEVGDRLSLAGLAIAYGRSEVYQGPYPSKGEVTSAGFKITYGPASTLEFRTVTGFELLCNTRWTFANITTHDAHSLTLQNTCHTGETIHGVRYAWRESPCAFKQCAVYEKVNSLPAPPFILTV